MIREFRTAYAAEQDVLSWSKVVASAVRNLICSLLSQEALEEQRPTCMSPKGVLQRICLLVCPHQKGCALGVDGRSGEDS